MKATKGKANPQVGEEILKSCLPSNVHSYASLSLRRACIDRAELG